MSKGLPYRHQRVGANAEVDRHHSLLPRERRGYRSFLHRLSQNQEGKIRRLRGRTLHERIQKADFEADSAKGFPSCAFARAPVWRGVFVLKNGNEATQWLKNIFAITEVMNLLEAEPSSGPVGFVPDFAAPEPDIPALREQLAMLMLTGKAKESIGVQLTYEQVKRLSDKDVEKYYKRYEGFVGAKTTDSLIGS